MNTSCGTNLNSAKFSNRVQSDIKGTRCVMAMAYNVTLIQHPQDLTQELKTLHRLQLFHLFFWSNLYSQHLSYTKLKRDVTQKKGRKGASTKTTADLGQKCRYSRSISPFVITITLLKRSFAEEVSNTRVQSLISTPLTFYPLHRRANSAQLQWVEHLITSSNRLAIFS